MPKKYIKLPDGRIIEADGAPVDSSLSIGGAAAEAKSTGERFEKLEKSIADYESLTLGVHTDGKVYIFKNGVPVGSGLDISGDTTYVEFPQMNDVVSRYMSEVQYDASDYTVSSVVPYIYEETAYDKGKPSGYAVNINQAGELYLSDKASTVKQTSTVGENILYNAIVGEVAKWWNVIGGTTDQKGNIKPMGQVRMINTTANNVRDLGGWTCDGGTIKYGKVFRGGLLDATDADVLVQQCGIKHDLDLRGKSDNGGIISSPLGSAVGYTCTDSYVWYSLTNETDWTMILRTIFDNVAANKPIIFHCAAGADRTGTVACILEAILGVSQPDIDKDFELTSFAIAPNARRRTDENWLNLIGEINAISVGTTFRDKVINWVGYLGFTADEINAFRAAMIDGTPDTIVIEEYAPVEPEVNYFDINTASLNARIGSSGSTSSYDGMVTTDFIEIDDSMLGKKIYVSGVTPITSTTYGYTGRVVWYNTDKSFNVGMNFENGVITPVRENTGHFKVSLVIKDNVVITADDVAKLKITLA